MNSKSMCDLKIGDLIIDDTRELDYSKVPDMTEEEYKEYWNKRSREINSEQQ